MGGTGQKHSKLFRPVDVSGAGIDFVHRWNPPAKHRDQLTNAFSGAGVAAGDYDQDGYPDLFICGQTNGGQLFRNLGNFKFANRSSLLKPPAPAGTWATGASWADVDNDGWLDLYVCGFDCPNRLYLNRPQGGGRVLVESASVLGVDFSGASIVGTFADYDRDGDLDLFVVTNRLPVPASLLSQPFSVSRGPNGEPVLPEAFRQYADVIALPGGKGFKKIDAGQYDHLYRNEGPGKPFREVTREAGMSGNHYGLSATWWDWNQDGWPDLYVANDFYGPDRLWTNNGPGADGGLVVVCDRYVASSVAYGEAQGLDVDWLTQTQRFLPVSDLTILLDIAPELAVARKAKGRDRYERDLSLLGRVRDSYVHQAEQAGWVRVDGDRGKADIAAEISAILVERLSPA